MPDLAAYATHSPFSDPGRHASLLAAVGTDPGQLHAAACSTVVHYRSGAQEQSPRLDDDINLRWLADILDEAQGRLPGPFDAPRPPAQQIAGCCRDHTLFVLGVLREHGVPARSRVGFAAYFRPGFHHDHVVAERWDGSRWVRFDAELTAGEDWFSFDAHDMPTGFGSPFESAAEAWLAHRRDGLDLSTYGVDPSMPELCGPEFVRGYVVTELAHRQREELLLWDVWGDTVPETATPPEELDRLADEIAALLVSADAGSASAEAELEARYASDPRLHPGGEVVTLSPIGRVGDADLVARMNRWRS